MRSYNMRVTRLNCVSMCYLYLKSALSSLFVFCTTTTTTQLLLHMEASIPCLVPPSQLQGFPGHNSGKTKSSKSYEAKATRKML